MPAIPAPPRSLRERYAHLERAHGQLQVEHRILELKLQKYERMIWARKSERLAPSDADQKLLFADPAKGEIHGPSPAAKASVGKSRQTPMGPKPLDPALPREVIAVPAPKVEDLICPVTRQPMQPGFVEALEVLARRPPQYYVKRYERTVFVSSAKSAPVYGPWPAEVLPRSRVHASVVAYLAAAHYCEHLPFYRIEQQLARVGVELPRNCQVSLMAQLDQIVAPLLPVLKQEIFGDGYLHVDATPIDLCDQARPGAVREATLWAYRGAKGVWFEYSTSKSPKVPDATLRAMAFTGFCQTDGAAGLDALGPPDQVTSLGCWAHARRPFFDAHQAKDPRAQWYLDQIGKLFRVERIAVRHGRRPRLRARFSVPIFRALTAQAEAHVERAPAKTALGDAVRYLLAQRERLERCLTMSAAELSNNAVERAVRPLKLGAKNWLFIGHPNAGPRLAHLYTLVENCRLRGLDPERYLADLITRLPDHPASRIAELLPHRWTGAPSAGA